LSPPHPTMGSGKRRELPRDVWARRFSVGSWSLHQADEDAVSWLSTQSKRDRRRRSGCNQEARRRERDAEDIEWGRKWEGCPPPQPTMGSGKRCELRRDVLVRPKTNLVHFPLYCSEYVYKPLQKAAPPMMSCCLWGAVKVLPLYKENET